VRGLKEVSERSGVRVIAMAGYYTEPCIPLDVDTESIDFLAERLITELTEGVEGTGIRAGILKSGIHYARIEGVERKALLAVARAARETGAAITTHTAGSRRYEVRGGNHGRQHLQFLREEGVPAKQLIVGHVDERPDVNYLSELAELGCYIQFDVINKEHWLLDETRTELIKELIDRGHLSQVLLGTDRCRKAELYRELGGAGYTFIFDVFIDVLGSKGVEKGEIEVLLAENPGRALAF
jgi:phosphotriesterase-related protein